MAQLADLDPPALEELMQYPQWVVWKYEDRDGKATKVPYNPKTSTTRASVADSSTWGTYAEAQTVFEKGGYSGRGFVFCKDDQFTGVDLDKCRDIKTGEIEPWAKSIIEKLDSYTEVSPSGTGVKVFLRGEVPGGGRRKGQIEMYSSGRYFTFTGEHVAGTPVCIHQRQEELQKLYDNTIGNAETAKTTSKQISYTANSTDAQVLQNARQSKKGPELERLWSGDITGYQSASEADLALCSYLAYWTNGDNEQMDRLFRQSGLFRAKWDEEHGNATYGEMTIAKALSDFEPRSYRDRGRGSSVPPLPICTTPRSSQGAGPTLAAEAFYGLAGEIVRMIEPHSEADPAALLIQLLIAFGNMVGRNPHFTVESTKHSLNLFGMLVGDTAKGRKGTSWGRIKRLFSSVDPEWELQNVAGLSSGEGLINAVSDSGTPDKKRVLVVETEFASTLQVLRREGNTLSPVIRQLWDSGEARVLNKNSPLHATDAHVSIIGHITREELLRHLNATEQANGFANRFLWVAAKRSKLLPRGGKLKDEDLKPLQSRLTAAVNFAGTVGEMEMEDDAWELWDDFYLSVSDGAPGLVGVVTARAEAQTRRLACISALMDSSKVVRKEHLAAAIALWQYCEASAWLIFGDATGNPTGDKILQALLSKAEGLTRTEISGLFARNKSAYEIEAALKELAANQLVESRPASSGSGRPAKRWFAVVEVEKAS